MPKLSRKREKKVMVFGVFDRFHPGHESFLRQAAQYGKVIAVVACDLVVKKIKGRMPCELQSVRLRRLRKIPHVWSAVLGDARQCSYAVIKKYKPDVVCLGYDQVRLAKDLKEKMNCGRIPKIRLIKLSPHSPKRFHSSLLIKRIY